MTDSIPRIEGLKDWEMGLLIELRLLHEAGALEPVLHTIAAGLAALAAEAERRDKAAQEQRLSQVIRKNRQRRSVLARAFTQAGAPKSRINEAAIRRLVIERSYSGRLLQGANYVYTEADIRWAMYHQIARAARIAAVNRCRKYIGSTT